MAHFKHCTDLATLYLSYTEIGDVGLANFKECKSLTALHLSTTQVGDTGLQMRADAAEAAFSPSEERPDGEVAAE